MFPVCKKVDTLRNVPLQAMHLLQKKNFTATYTFQVVPGTQVMWTTLYTYSATKRHEHDICRG